LKQREAIPDSIRTFDIALQARAVDYASPLKLFEYMACGRAIVAPDQPNIREILTNEENALLFDPDKPASLWQAIRRLAADPELRERLGYAAREILDARDYTWEGNATRVIQLAVADLNRRGAAASDVSSPDRSLSRG
jgi:glycosyltransferase involved in cell wall biosynthesis